MRLSRSVGLTLGLFVVGSLAGSCSSPSPGGRTNATGGSGSSTGGSTSSQGGSGVPVAFGGSGITLPSAGANAGGNTTGVPDQCATSTTNAKLVPLDLYVLMDSSKSMLEPTTAGGTKWKAVTDAMTAFFNDPNTTDLNVALKYFPDETPSVPAVCTADADCGATAPCDQRKACVAKDTFSKIITQEDLCSTDASCPTGAVCAPVQRCADGANCAKQYCVSGGTGTALCPADCVPFTGYCRSRDVCTAADYAAPAVPFTALPAGAAMLSQSFAARTPDGFTPTGPALTGALQAAQERITANPDHKVVVVIVTDGLPGGFIPGSPPPGCTPADIPGIGNVLATGVMGTPAVPTFVIGVFGPCDLIDQNTMPQQNLDTLATSGGTSKAVIIRTDQNVTQGLQDALKLVRTSSIACQYTIPTPTEGMLDYQKVNVKFTSAATPTSTVLFAGSKAACDPATGGWYYDTDPTKASPKQIILCDNSCTSFQAAQGAHVDIELGCATQMIR
jgi:hypothetical protein